MDFGVDWMVNEISSQPNDIQLNIQSFMFTYHIQRCVIALLPLLNIDKDVNINLI